jgi:hypothetical protein
MFMLVPLYVLCYFPGWQYDVPVRGYATLQEAGRFVACDFGKIGRRIGSEGSPDRRLVVNLPLGSGVGGRRLRRGRTQRSKLHKLDDSLSLLRTYGH